MGRVVHFEFNTTDPERTTAFLSDVFGWKIDKWDGPSAYWMVTTGADTEQGIGGGIQQAPGGTSSHTVNTVDVSSVDEAVAKATAAGGQVAVPKMAIPGMGWVAYCTDPTGLVFGVFEQDPQAS
jgi:predicted enzyme related to lactoylglutathione lyase